MPLVADRFAAAVGHRPVPSFLPLVLSPALRAGELADACDLLTCPPEPARLPALGSQRALRGVNALPNIGLERARSFRCQDGAKAQVGCASNRQLFFAAGVRRDPTKAFGVDAFLDRLHGTGDIATAVE